MALRRTEIAPMRDDIRRRQILVMTSELQRHPLRGRNNRIARVKTVRYQRLILSNPSRLSDTSWAAYIRPAQNITVHSNKLRYIDRERSKTKLVRVQQVRLELVGHMKENSCTLLEDKFIVFHPLQRGT